MEKYVISFIAICMALSSVMCFLIMYSSGKSRNWEQEDEEQMKFIKTLYARRERKNNE